MPFEPIRKRIAAQAVLTVLVLIGAGWLAGCQGPCPSRGDKAACPAAEGSTCPRKTEAGACPTEASSTESPRWQAQLAAVKQRDWPVHKRTYANGAVSHPAWYLRGGMHEFYPGGELPEADTYTTWSGRDALSLAGDPGYFLLQVAYLPVELVEAPPWRMQQSRSVLPPGTATYELINDDLAVPPAEIGAARQADH